MKTIKIHIGPVKNEITKLENYSNSFPFGVPTKPVSLFMSLKRGLFECPDKKGAFVSILEPIMNALSDIDMVSEEKDFVKEVMNRLAKKHDDSPDNSKNLYDKIKKAEYFKNDLLAFIGKLDFINSGEIRSICRHALWDVMEGFTVEGDRAFINLDFGIDTESDYYRAYELLVDKGVRPGYRASDAYESDKEKLIQRNLSIILLGRFLKEHPTMTDKIENEIHCRNSLPGDSFEIRLYLEFISCACLLFRFNYAMIAKMAEFAESDESLEIFKFIHDFHTSFYYEAYILRQEAKYTMVGEKPMVCPEDLIYLPVASHKRLVDDGINVRSSDMPLTSQGASSPLVNQKQPLDVKQTKPKKHTHVKKTPTDK